MSSVCPDGYRTSWKQRRPSTQRRTETGWEKNELDYLLVRTPLPVLGGFEYVITFGGGDKELCGPWSLDATHPR